LVPTPIGNLEDMTLRAIRILKEVDLILSEDTRNTLFLCKHFGIETHLQSFHKDNEHKVLANIITKLKTGTTIALVSDAGTPGISDPGFLLVRECLKNDIEIECLPGATAFVPALVNSGFPTDRFVFEGFLPHQKGRNTRWQQIKDEMRTIVLYESPYRILRLLKEAVEHLEPERKISVSRELTKKFEETVRGTAVEVLEHFTSKEPKGEFVVVIEGKKK
jgi:16S rRNA (cytidine1402-2'-O)-methyltransferase